MSLKDSFWTGLQGGLLDKKHYMKMGMSIWLFGYLTRSQTALNIAGEGVVNYGHPLTLKQIGTDLKGISVRTIRLWITRLRREGYIRTEEHGQRGLAFWIIKAKQKTKRTKVHQERLRHNSVAKLESLRHESVSKEEFSRYPVVTSQGGDSLQAITHEPFVAIPDSATPKGSTPKNLSYYNNTVAAKPAAVFLSGSLKAILETKTIPRGKSSRELDATRRLLLKQGADVLRKYPSSGVRAATA